MAPRDIFVILYSIFLNIDPVAAVMLVILKNRSILMHLIVRQLLVKICWSSKIENVGCEIEEVVEKYSRN